MASTSQTPAAIPPEDDYDSAEDPDFALPAQRPMRASRPRTTHRPSGSGSAGSSSSSSAGSSSDEDGGDTAGGRSPKRARRSALETRSGHVYGSEAGPSAVAPLATTGGGEADRPPMTLAQLQTLDRERTLDMLAGGTSAPYKGKGRDDGAEQMVTVRVKHHFAGEDVWVEKSVLASSKEARIWCEPEAASSLDGIDEDRSLLRRDVDLGIGGELSPSPGAEGANRDGLDVLRTLSSPRQSAQVTPPPPIGGLDSSSAAATALDQPSPSTPAPPPPGAPAARLPPPKKRKGGGLAAAAIAAKNKGKKMSTVEKSAMDWRSHRAEELTEEERDQLARNRQVGGGGFLEKQEFLSRVQERRGI